jgi:pimeloyl-ACP methyl ester carboxylesterase
MAPREVRQPEVARLGYFLLALALVVSAVRGVSRVVLASAFLAEFTAGGWPLLSALTARPVESTRTLPGVAADAFTPRTVLPPTPLVLVPGATPDGKDDPRARGAARLLARVGFDVTLPTIPGLTTGRLRPEDVTPVVTALAAARAPAVVVSVSVGSGPALLAAADARVRDRVALVVVLGGYGSAEDLVRFYLTGSYAYGGVSGRRQHDPALVRAFVDANVDLLDEAARALVDRIGDPAAGRAITLSSAAQQVLRALSPVNVLPALRGHLVLVHGRDDPVVPFTESVRLADAARPGGATLVVLDVLGHVGGEAGPDWAALARLWAVTYRLVCA